MPDCTRDVSVADADAVTVREAASACGCLVCADALAEERTPGYSMPWLRRRETTQATLQIHEHDDG